MKKTIFATFMLIGLLMGCSHVHNPKRIPSALNDVGVIAPDGEVILYYKEGPYIIVQACAPNTILGKTPEQARKQCEGRINKVPVETFKEAIRNMVSMDRLSILKPLTPDEIVAYKRGALTSEQVESMLLELEKINNFIAVYGAENANIIRKEELIRALGSNQLREKAIKKIDVEVEKVLNLIVGQTKLTLTKYNQEKDQFLYTVLKQFDPNQNFPCGIEGSIEERITDCSYQLTAQKEGFVLVTRSTEFKEVHMERSTGLLWSDRLPKMNHYAAEKACGPNLKEVANITGLNWSLPSIEDYKEADKSGIRKGLPNMNHWFWSSSLHPKESKYAWLFVGLDGHIGYGENRLTGNGSVRCVGR